MVVLTVALERVQLCMYFYIRIFNAGKRMHVYDGATRFKVALDLDVARPRIYLECINSSVTVMYACKSMLCMMKLLFSLFALKR